MLRGPQGALAPIASMPRSLPHDRRRTPWPRQPACWRPAWPRWPAWPRPLATFTGPRHRIELVGHADGVDWYDDSKATTPHAATTAIRGFERVVLVAGGRNKGLDLAPLGDVAGHLRAVVAIGEAAPEVAKAFDGSRPTVPVEEASTMSEAVDTARRLAQPGDVVLLSPACASFDWYSSYGERGDHFARLVREELGSSA